MHVTRSSINPIEHLRLFLRACSCVHHMNLVHILWTRKPHLVRVVDHLTKNFQHDHDGPLQTWGCIFLPLLYMGAGLTSVCVLHESPPPNHSLFEVLIGLRSPFFNPKCNLPNTTLSLNQTRNDVGNDVLDTIQKYIWRKKMCVFLHFSRNERAKYGAFVPITLLQDNAKLQHRRHNSYHPARSVSPNLELL